MKTGAQLRLKGVRPQAIETAREAARRSGLSLGEWLDSAIIETAAESGVEPSPPAQEPSVAGENFLTVQHRLDEIVARLDRLAQHADPPAPKMAERPDPELNATVRDLESRLGAMAQEMAPRGGEPPRRLDDAIARLNSRLDELITPRQTEKDVNPRVAAVDRALSAMNREQARAPTPPASPAADHIFGLEEAVAEISARQRDLDAGPASAAPVPGPDLSGLEQQLRTITEQLETLRRPCGVEDAVAALRRELGEIGRTLAEALPRRTLEAIHAEIRTLADRVDMDGRRGVDPTALSGVERNLAEVRAALGALAPAESVAGYDEDVKALSRKIDQIAASGPDAETLEHLETAIAELRNVSARVASGDALAALAGEVRTIGAKLDHYSPAVARDADGDDHLVRRIDALAAALDARGSGPSAPDTTRIENLLKTLTERLERVPAADERNFDQLERQIMTLAQKLDAADARLGQLGAIEHAIADLVEQLHDARASAIDAAEQAARTAAREIVSQTSGAGAGVEALRHELAELRDAQAAIDRRIQDTLEAVHHTLERLVDRIAGIETDIHAGARAAAQATPVSKLASGSVAARPVNPDPPPDLPLEPGSGAPRTRGPATPAERIAASEAVLATANPPITAEPTGKANFIAAARRAAQAAASDGTGDTDRSGKALGTSMFGSLGTTLARRRRPLMIGVGVLLLLIGTVHIVTNMMGWGEPARPPGPGPAAIPRAVPKAASPAPQPSAPAAASEAAPQIQPDPPPPAPERQSDRAPAKDITASVPAGNALPTKPMTFPTLPNFTAIMPTDITGTTLRPPTTALMTSPAAPVNPAGPAAETLPATIGGPALRTAALAGNAGAAFEVAIRYAEGRGVAVSFPDAVRWFERGANQGLAPAQYRLGSLYEKGQGVKKDLEAARRLYTAAADKGNAKAMHNLAVLYAEGLDGKPDYRNASQWFRKAADRGVADSQYNLGILYARGVGVDQNLAESFKWFALAAQQGDQDAGKKRDDVTGRLDPQALVAARLAVQTWTPDPQPDEAVNVKAPAGGWDRPATATPPKVKPPVGMPRKLGS